MSYTLTQTVAPTDEPVPLERAKRHVRVSHSADDEYIGDLIAAARDLCERKLEQSFVTQTWKLVGGYFEGEEIGLPNGPVQSITAVKYYDTDNVLQTLDAGYYEFDVLPGKLRIKSGYAWPEAYARGDAVEITYVAGYGLPSAVPPAIRQAIRMTLGHWYENRESVVVGGGGAAELPQAVKDCLRSAWPGNY